MPTKSETTTRMYCPRFTNITSSKRVENIAYSSASPSFVAQRVLMLDAASDMPYTEKIAVEKDLAVWDELSQKVDNTEAKDHHHREL